MSICIYVCMIFLVFNDGTWKDLFTLQGTIPVVYKSELIHAHTHSQLI